MVNNAYENGILDIAGALAGSYVIIIICMFLCKYCSGIKKILLFYGKKFLNSFMLSFSGVEYVPLGNGVWIYNFSWDE